MSIPQQIPAYSLLSTRGTRRYRKRQIPREGNAYACARNKLRQREGHICAPLFPNDTSFDSVIARRLVLVTRYLTQHGLRSEASCLACSTNSHSPIHIAARVSLGNQRDRDIYRYLNLKVSHCILFPHHFFIISKKH
jgi:hypothetical protein